MWIKQSTAVVLSFGPCVDKTDGVTLEVGLVSALDHASTGIMLSKNGGALTIRNAAVTASTYDAYGNYLVTLDTTDTNTLGMLRTQYTDPTTCLPVWVDCMIVPANVWDSMFGADVLQVDIAQYLGTAVPSPDTAGYPKVTIKDGTGQGELLTTSGKIDGVILVDTLTTYTGNTLQTGDSFARIGVPVLASISLDVASCLHPTVAGRTLGVNAGFQAGIDWGNVGNQSAAVDLSGSSIGNVDFANVTTIADGSITATTIADGAIDAATFAAGAINAAATANDFIAEVKAQADQALADYDAPTNTEMVAAFTQIKGASWAGTDTLEGIYDKTVTIDAKTTNLPALPANEATLTTIATYVDTEVASTLAAVDTEVALIKAQTDLIPASPAAVGSQMKLETSDGVTHDNFMKSIMAVLFGEAVPSGSTVEFKLRDGSTTKVTVIYGSTDGERTSSVIA